MRSCQGTSTVTSHDFINEVTDLMDLNCLDVDVKVGNSGPDEVCLGGIDFNKRKIDLNKNQLGEKNERKIGKWIGRERAGEKLRVDVKGYHRFCYILLFIFCG